MVTRRAVFLIVWSSYPSPPLLDSSFRWNDEIGRGSLSRIGVRDMLWHPMSERIDTANGFVIYCR